MFFYKNSYVFLKKYICFLKTDSEKKAAKCKTSIVKSKDIIVINALSAEE